MKKVFALAALSGLTLGASHLSASKLDDAIAKMGFTTKLNTVCVVIRCNGRPGGLACADTLAEAQAKAALLCP